MRRPQTLFVLVFLAGPLFAQAPLIEKIDVSVVNVDVTVTDHAGKPVRGLTRADFEVFEDGRAQPITNFYAVVAAEGRGAPLVLDERFRRKVLVIVDNVTTTRYNRDRALDRLEKFINDRFTGGAYDWSVALIDRRARMLLAPTSDKQQVFEAIGEIRRLVAGEVIDNSIAPTSTLSCANQRLSGMLSSGDRLQLAASEGNAIGSLTQAVRGFSSVLGKKIILLLTSDFVLRGAFDPLAVTVCMPSGARGELIAASRERTRLSEYLVREANASNVSLYIVNTEGFRPGGWDLDDHPGATAATEVFVPPTDNGALFWLARETGGRLLPDNDVSDSLKTFDTTTSNFYSLGYRPTHREDEKYHRIQVRMSRPGTFHLQYRNGYSSISSHEQVIRLLQSPLAPALQSSSLPVQITIGAQIGTEKKGELLVPITAAVPLSSLTFLPGASAPLEVFFSLFDASGRNIALIRFDREAKSGGEEFVERHVLKLEKGEPYRVVVAIRDPLTDAIGIAQQAVKF